MLLGETISAVCDSDNTFAQPLDSEDRLGGLIRAGHELRGFDQQPMLGAREFPGQADIKKGASGSLFTVLTQLQQRRDHQTHDRHDINQNIHSGTRGIFEGISHSVTHHGSGMSVRAFAA